MAASGTQLSGCGVGGEAAGGVGGQASAAGAKPAAASTAGVPGEAAAGGASGGKARFDVRTLPPVVVLTGHYGAGKTNLALNLAHDAAAAGASVALADLDVVNPYFRSSDYGGLLADTGVELIAPAFAGTTLDSPGITGKVAAAIDWAREGAAGQAVAAAGTHAAGVPFGMSGAPSGSRVEAPAARRLLIIDAGGDDVGATALGRFSRAIAQGPHAMLHVVNRSRNLTPGPAEALAVMREVEQASRLKVTAIVNNTHLADQTTLEVLEGGAAFARKVAEAANVPLAFTAVESSFEGAARNLGVVYPVRILVRKPWE